MAMRVSDAEFERFATFGQPAEFCVISVSERDFPEAFPLPQNGRIPFAEAETAQFVKTVPEYNLPRNDPQLLPVPQTAPDDQQLAFVAEVLPR